MRRTTKKLVRNKEAEQREIKKLKDSIIKELEAPGGHYSPLKEAYITGEGFIYPREYLEDNGLSRFIPKKDKERK